MRLYVPLMLEVQQLAVAMLEVPVLWTLLLRRCRGEIKRIGVVYIGWMTVVKIMVLCLVSERFITRPSHLSSRSSALHVYSSHNDSAVSGNIDSY